MQLICEYYHYGDLKYKKPVPIFWASIILNTMVFLTVYENEKNYTSIINQKTFNENNFKT